LCYFSGFASGIQRLFPGPPSVERFVEWKSWSKSLQHLFRDGWDVLIALIVLIGPWTPLIAWIAFWLLAVNWEKLYPVLAKGGAIGSFWSD